MAKRNKTTLYSRILSLDKFGTHIRFNFGGRSSFPSYSGAILSLLILIVIIPYAVNKFIIMWEFGDTHYQTVTIERGIDVKKEFSTDETNLQLMFMIGNESLNGLMAKDYEEYVQIYARSVRFDKDPFHLEEQALTTRPCTIDDLNRFNTDKSQREVFEYQLSSLQCVQGEDAFTIAGNLHELSSKSFVIGLARCNSQLSRCKGEREIDRFLQSSYLLIYHNDQQYSPDTYGAHPVSKTVKEHVFPVD